MKAIYSIFAVAVMALFVSCNTCTKKAAETVIEGEVATQTECVCEGDSTKCACAEACACDTCETVEAEATTVVEQN